MRALIEIRPTSNYAVASTAERSDQGSSLARVLMGLSHPVQFVSQARETAGVWDWANPPRLKRRWLAVVTADDQTTLDWRVRTLRSALEGVGLRCATVDSLPALTSAETCAAGVSRCLPINNQLVVYADALRLGDSEWCSTLVLRRWPREVAPGWLGQAIAGDLPVDLAIHIQPQDPQRIARFLKRQGAWQNDGGKDAANALGHRDAEVTRQKLIARTDRPVKVAVLLTVRAADRATLKQRVATMQHEIGLALGDARPATFEQDHGLEATQPLGVCNVLGVYRTLDCASVASTWPFQPATVNHANGADLGTTHDGSMLVRLDPFDPSLESFGSLVIGKTGVGKTYLLQLIIRRLSGVKVLVVDQRHPSQYAGTPGVEVISLAGLSKREKIAKLREFITELWAEARRNPLPLLLILDELYALLKEAALADLIEEIAREGRSYYVSLLIATQQVRELLESGQAVLDNAAIRIYLKQHDNDLEKLCDAVGLPIPARRFLRSAGRGQALIDVGGLLVPVDIQATPEEHRQITTDPREGRRHDRTVDSVEDHANDSRPDLGRSVAAVGAA